MGSLWQDLREMFSSFFGGWHHGEQKTAKSQQKFKLKFEVTRTKHFTFAGTILNMGNNKLVAFEVVFPKALDVDAEHLRQFLLDTMLSAGVLGGYKVFTDTDGETIRLKRAFFHLAEKFLEGGVERTSGTFESEVTGEHMFIRVLDLT